MDLRIKIDRQNFALSSMNTLITGGAGFIGFELLSQWPEPLRSQVVVADFDEVRLRKAKEKFKINSVLGDVTDVRFMAEIVEKYKVSKIIHLAANSDIKNGSTNSNLDFRNTLMSSLALAEIIKHFPISRVLFSSSSAVYGIQEQALHANNPILKEPISSYGWAKLGSEYALQLSSILKKTTLQIFRFPNVVGPTPTHGILYDMKLKLKKDSKKLDVLGDGSQTKPYMHVSELSNILLTDFFNEGSQGGIYNIGPKSLVSVKEIIEIILKVSKLDPKITWGESAYGWVGDVPNYEFDSNFPASLTDSQVMSSREAVESSFKAWWSQ